MATSNYRHNNYSSLEQKWNNGLATLRVILEFTFVIALLATSPDSHLDKASNHKDKARHRLRHDRIAEPCTSLISVIRA